MSNSDVNILRDVTCSAPVNIAIVKYWGKRDETLHLPQNGSLSVTLDQRHLATKTRVRLSRDFDQDRLFLNDEESVVNKRVATCLEEIRRRCRKRSGSNSHEKGDKSDFLFDSSVCVRIDSWNNFPTAAGLASSAAGYACLVFALSKAYRVGGEVSDIARRGSGSACRSIYGGFVEWDPGFDATPSIAKQLFSASHWPELRVCIAVVSDQRKSTSSSDGMKRSVATSPFLRHRADVVVPERLKALEAAIADRDFERFAEITMKESNSLHAVCMDTFPPIKYQNETSHAIMNLVHAINDLVGRSVLCYTFDAGPNAFLFFESRDSLLLRPLLCRVFDLDPDDPHLVRGINQEQSIPNRGSKEGEEQEKEEEITVKERNLLIDKLQSHGFESELKGKVKFLIFTQTGGGPQVLEEN